MTQPYGLLWLYLHKFNWLNTFLWKNLKVPRLNSLSSKAGLFVILLEPIAAIYMIKNKNLRNNFLITYGLYITGVLLTHRFDFSTKVGLNGHLQWNWIIPFWSLPWFVFLLAPMWIGGQNNGTFLFASITLLMTLYFYFRYKTAGTMWCWIAVSLGFSIFLIRQDFVTFGSKFLLIKNHTYSHQRCNLTRNDFEHCNINLCYRNHHHNCIFDSRT